MRDVRAAPLIAWVEGIGVRGPGLGGWIATRDVLARDARHESAATVLVPPPLLPSAERRRVGKGVKVALEVGFEAVAQSGRDAATLASVFASSSGDGDNCDAICRALATDRMISPTRFHNSVHNAPSGYWGIAAQAHAASTSLCAFDASFAAGLIDAVAQLAGGANAVLLVAYDAPYPEPLFTQRPTPDAFGVALVLAREASANAIVRIEIAAAAADIKHQTRMFDATLESCRVSVPAARALPVLAAIARLTSTVIVDDGIDDTAAFEEITIEHANETCLSLTVRTAEFTHHSSIKEPARCA